MDVSKANVAKVLALSTAVAGGMIMWLWLMRKRRPHPVTDKVMMNCIKKRDIRVVTTIAEWENCVAQLLPHNREAPRFLGIDCEWVAKHPVALLQIASPSGFCVLVRLGNVGITSIPQSLQTLLQDKRILKLGVSVTNDAKKLELDYGLKVNGCVDLRNIMNRVKGIYRCHKMGLQGLAKVVLDKHLSKDISIRCSNWEAEHLSSRQIDYAAMDALVAVDIFTHLVMAKIIGFNPRSNSELTSSVTKEKFLTTLNSLCQGVVDVSFINNSRLQEKTGSSQPKKLNEQKQNSDVYTTRKRPLWDNCELLAPDGEALCTCDSRKAAWYISKGLGEKVRDNPLTVQLNFEPSGRPKSDRNYYLQQKENQCVVCGKTESYVRKFIVPQEYRKFFPLLLKEHSSHDVLLMCPPCHRQSSEFDGLLRSQLARECHAPLNSGDSSSVSQDYFLQKVKSAGRALKLHRDQIPPTRVEELEEILRDYFGVHDITKELEESASNVDFKTASENYVTHAQRVVEYMTEHDGLLEFQARWRQHFTRSMRPQYLPAFWSVDYVPENWKDELSDDSAENNDNMGETGEETVKTDDKSDKDVSTYNM